MKLKDNEKVKKKKPIILLDGQHHAREMVCLTTILYTFCNAIFQYAKNNREYINILKEVELVFLPVVNIDGYLYIEKLYDLNPTYDLALVRKNRNFTIPCKEYITSSFTHYFRDDPWKIQSGVDLNRNYGLGFAYDDNGSSDDPCNMSYRGSAPFSEPETQALRDFAINNPSIKIALNFHSHAGM